MTWTSGSVEPPSRGASNSTAGSSIFPLADSSCGITVAGYLRHDSPRWPMDPGVLDALRYAAWRAEEREVNLVRIS
jgi:hypothetical protein